MTPRHRRRLSVLVASIALLLPLLDALRVSASPIDDKRAEAARIAAKLDAMGEHLSVLDEQFNQARIRLTQAQAQVAAARQKAAETAQRYEAAKARARDSSLAWGTDSRPQSGTSDRRPVAYRRSTASSAATVILSTRSARARGCRRSRSTRSARPTSIPACGPPRSLSPENDTRSAPAASASATAGSSAGTSGKRSSNPLPTS